MNEHEWQDALFALADKLLDEALADGEAFSEGLCNWATHQAEQQIPARPIA
jgi:hypothetical protein